jgi:hypothetical protein
MAIFIFPDFEDAIPFHQYRNLRAWLIAFAID